MVHGPVLALGVYFAHVYSSVTELDEPDFDLTCDSERLLYITTSVNMRSLIFSQLFLQSSL